MFSRADYALLQGKKSGKSGVYLYRREHHEVAAVAGAAESKGAEDSGIDRDMELIWMESERKRQASGLTARIIKPLNVFTGLWNGD